MQNVKLEKGTKGWFLTIDDGMTHYTWAVSSEELWCIHKLIADNMEIIIKEMKKVTLV